MSTRTLIGDLADLVQLSHPIIESEISYAPLDQSHRDQVADLYLACYPSHIGAADVAEARAEMDATYAGDYGQLITEASLVAFCGEQAVGSIQVVQRSPWEPDLDCPFIIELFVRPGARDRGIGRSLLSRAAVVCRRLGQTRIALRTGDGTSPAAQHLYAVAGMGSWPENLR